METVDLVPLRRRLPIPFRCKERNAASDTGHDSQTSYSAGAGANRGQETDRVAQLQARAGYHVATKGSRHQNSTGDAPSCQ
jgi:hypothetical protein